MACNEREDRPMNFIERAARQAALPPLCTCGTALKVRGTEPLVLEPCPTCLDALRRGVAARIEAIYSAIQCEIDRRVDRSCFGTGAIGRDDKIG